MNKLEKAKALEEEAKKLKKEYHDERPLPKVWNVGQKIRYLHYKEWAWNAGSTNYVVELRDEYKGLPAKEYQVFYTGPKKGGAFFWTTPDDVELVEDVNDE